MAKKIVEEKKQEEQKVESGKVNIKRIADGVYNGFDGQDPVLDALKVCKGEVVSLSESKAEQLIADYPNDWELV